MVKRFVLTEEPDADEAAFSFELGPEYTGISPIPTPIPVGYPIYKMLPHQAYKIVQSNQIIYSGDAASNLPGLSAPAGNFRMKISVSDGQDNTGSVIIYGELEGVAVEETVTFSRAYSKYSTKLLDTLTAINTTGFTDESPIPTILINGVDFNNSPLAQEVRTSLMIRFENKITHYMNAAGSFQASESRAFTIDNTINIGDIIEYNGKYYPVEHIVARCDLTGIERFRVLQFGRFRLGR